MSTSGVVFDAVRLSAQMETMFDSFRHPTVRRAVTFDEVTLEDRPSDVLPNVNHFNQTHNIEHTINLTILSIYSQSMLALT
jgi:hypothetical protein